MPITVTHAPDASLVGGAAYGAGLSQYSQRQREIDTQNALRHAALVSQQQESRRRLELARQQLSQSDRLAWARQKLAEDTLKARGVEADAARRHALMMQGNIFSNQDLREDDRRSYEWSVGSAVDLDAEVGKLVAEDSKREFTPEGKRIQGELSGKLRAIQKQRANLRPQQYNDLLGQWLADYERAGVQNYAVKEPTPQELWQQRSVQLPDGGLAIWQPDGKGGGKFDRFDAKQETGAQFLTDDKRYKEAAKVLTERKAMQNPNEMLPADWEPPAHEVFNEVLRQKKERDKFAKMAPVIEKLTNAGAEVKQVDEKGRILVEMNGRQQWMEPEVVEALSSSGPEGAAAIAAQQNAGQQNAPPIPTAREQIMNEAAPGSELPQGPQPGGDVYNINQSGPAARQIVEQNVARPQSAKEIEQLTPGTLYLAPDGTIRRRGGTRRYQR